MSEYTRRLWDALDEIKTGMLALADTAVSHSQPMTAHYRDHEGTLFFFAPAQARLVKDIGQGRDGLFHYAGPGHALYACIHGLLSIESDPAPQERFWTDEVAKCFPEGLGYPSVTLLRFEAKRGQVWLNGPVVEEIEFGKHVDLHAKVTL